MSIEKVPINTSMKECPLTESVLGAPFTGTKLGFKPDVTVTVTVGKLLKVDSEDVIISEVEVVGIDDVTGDGSVNIDDVIVSNEVGGDIEPTGKTQDLARI